MAETGGSSGNLSDADRRSSLAAVLLLDPPMERDRHAACLTNLIRTDSPSDPVCRIEFDQAITGWLAQFEALPDAQRGAVSVINATGVSWTEPSTELLDQVTVLGEPGPSNLTEIGTLVTGFLTDPETGQDRPRVCIHSLTTLLQYVETTRVFRFLHQLIQHAKSTGAFIHFHLNAGVHDDQTVNLFSMLADDVVTVEASEANAEEAL